MKTRTFRMVIGVGLGLSLSAWLGCGKDSAIEVRHDNQGKEEIKIDKGKIRDNLHQAGEELSKDAHNLGQAIRKGAHDVDQKVGPAARESLADAALTARVKARLIAATDLNGIRIHVSSRDGQVTLSGTVSSEENRLEAEKIARHTDGVVEVDNHLEVGPMS
jgi:hyperosmotically inducible periplasmic protein